VTITIERLGKPSHRDTVQNVIPIGLLLLEDARLSAGGIGRYTRRKYTAHLPSGLD
jgi:hypothetical protein